MSFRTNVRNLNQKQFFVYIMASISGVIYVGMTNDLTKRIWQHKNDLIDGFTKKYRCHKLIYFEECGDVMSVIEREKEIKKWRREKKVKLIESVNKNWNDLSTNW